MRHKEQRVGIFIDIQNLYHSSRNLYKARVNYKELIKELVAGRKLIRSIAYVVKSDTALGEKGFFDSLSRVGLELRTKDLQIYPDGTKKADWDIGMAVDALRMSDFLDVVILVTGDGDFIPLIQYLQYGKGRSVEVAAFGRTASGKIQDIADEFINIEKIPKALFKI